VKDVALVGGSVQLDSFQCCLSRLSVCAAPSVIGLRSGVAVTGLVPADVEYRAVN